MACPSAGACGGQFTANTMATVSRGDRAGAARLGRRAGAVRGPRPLGGGERPRGDAPAGEQPASARHLHARGVRERGRRGGGDRRQHQCRAAPAGDGARGGDPLHHGRRGGHLPPHAVHRRPEARREVRGVRRAQDRRHPRHHQGAAGWRAAARRLHHRDRQDAGREPRRRGVPDRPGRGLSGVARHLAHRRRGRAARQPGAGRRHREGRGHGDAAVRGHRAVLRLRGGRVRRRAGARLQGRRRDRHPLRGAARRARHAGDAVHHQRDLRPGHGRGRGADHRRPVLRRHARLLRGPCRAGGGAGRPDRPAAERRPHRAGRRGGHDGRAAVGGGVGRAPGRLEAARAPTTTAAPSGNSPRLVGPAHLGAVTNPGGAAETHCYADI